jgi:hypothetical protein
MDNFFRGSSKTTKLNTFSGSRVIQSCFYCLFLFLGAETFSGQSDLMPPGTSSDQGQQGYLGFPGLPGGFNPQIPPPNVKDPREMEYEAKVAQFLVKTNTGKSGQVMVDAGKSFKMDDLDAKLNQHFKKSSESESDKKKRKKRTFTDFPVFADSDENKKTHEGIRLKKIVNAILLLLFKII